MPIWLSSCQASDAAARYWNWLLHLYLAAVSMGWLLPLDLSCRPHELLEKLRGNVNLEPFSDIVGERGLAALATWALFLPVGVLLATAGRSTSGHVRTERECRWLIGGLALLLTTGQFLVLSRETDLLQIASLGLGLVGGVWLARLVTGALSIHRRLKFFAEASRTAFHSTARLESAWWVLLCRFYVAAVLASALGVLWAARVAVPGEIWFTGRSISNWQPTWPIIAYWLGLMALLLFVPRLPILAPISFVLLAYGPFHHGEYFRAIGGQFMVSLLGLTGVVLATRGHAVLSGVASAAGGLAVAYALWALASAAYLWLDARPWLPSVAAECIRLVECAVVVWTVRLAVANQRNHWWLAFTTSITILLGGVLYPETMYLNHAAASLAAIGLPLLIYALVSAPSIAVQIVISLGLLKLGEIVYAGQSRSAMAGAMAGLLTYAVLSRHRLWLVSGALAGGVAAWLAAQDSFIAQRFEALLRQEAGWDTGRLELWNYALQVFQAFPVFGMGPGTGPSSLGDVHNSYLAVLSETGAVGLALYATFWLSTMLIILRAMWLTGDRWPASAAKAVFAAIIAHLTIGCGYSLHALQLAFLIAGSGLALDSAALRASRPRLG